LPIARRTGPNNALSSGPHGGPADEKQREGSNAASHRCSSDQQGKQG
jgi:hypothetical protein